MSPKAVYALKEVLSIERAQGCRACSWIPSFLCSVSPMRVDIQVSYMMLIILRPHILF